MPSSLDLLDANVWLALAVEAHAQHERAEAYWRHEAAPLSGFCRVTLLALLRHLSNRAIMGQQVLTPAAAWEKRAEFLALPEVRLVEEPGGLDNQLAEFCQTGQTSPNFWTDAYLAAFAKSGGMRMVTFDAGFSRFPGLELLLLKAR